MRDKIKKWIFVLFIIQLIIKLILSTSPYSSFDEREYIEIKNKSTIPERGFMLRFLSYLFPSLIFGRIFVAIFTSFPLLLLPFIEDKIISKNKLLFTSLIVFNPLLLKLSSMYLTDAIFFTFIIIFVYLKSKRRELQTSIISCVSMLVRFEGLLLAFINIIDLLIRKNRKMIFVQLLLLLCFVPVVLKGIELYLSLIMLIYNLKFHFLLLANSISSTRYFTNFYSIRNSKEIWREQNSRLNIHWLYILLLYL